MNKKIIELKQQLFDKELEISQLLRQLDLARQEIRELHLEVDKYKSKYDKTLCRNIRLLEKCQSLMEGNDEAGILQRR